MVRPSGTRRAANKVISTPLSRRRAFAQARAAGRALRSVLSHLRGVVVETSPLGRAKQTAALLCGELDIPVDDIVVSPLLIEHGLGVWQGLTYAEIDEVYPGARAQREANKWEYRVEDGESYALVGERARQWLSARTASVTIAVTHEMISRTIQGAYAGLSPQDTLGRSHRQDQIFRLSEGQLTELSAD
jgi:broad specificity phosphatase PhoE